MIGSNAVSAAHPYGYCQYSCGRCARDAAANNACASAPVIPQLPPTWPTPAAAHATCNCTDVTPPGGFSCAAQRDFAKCFSSWMLRRGQGGPEYGYCEATCGRCTCGANGQPVRFFEGTAPSPAATSPSPTPQPQPAPSPSPMVPIEAPVVVPPPVLTLPTASPSPSLSPPQLQFPPTSPLQPTVLPGTTQVQTTSPTGRPPAVPTPAAAAGFGLPSRGGLGPPSVTPPAPPLPPAVTAVAPPLTTATEAPPTAAVSGTPPAPAPVLPAVPPPSLCANNLLAIMAARPQLNISLGLIVQLANVTSGLLRSDLQATLLVPTNEAWQQFFAENGIQPDDFFASEEGRAALAGDSGQ